MLHKVKIKPRINTFQSEENRANKQSIFDIPEECRNIYDIIVNPLDTNDIVKITKMNVKDVTSKLTILELEGKIKRIAGNRYVRIE